MPSAPPTIEQWEQDLLAVLDTTGIQRVHVLANADTSLIALRLAADWPERVRSLTLINGYARFTAGPDYPYGMPTAAMAERLHNIHTPGAPPIVDVLAWRLPSVAGDLRFRAWWDAIGRRGASPRTAALVHDVIMAADVREVLGRITAPVLLLSRLGGGSYDPGHGRYLAEHLAHAELREHNDPNDAWFVGDVDWVVGQLNEFVRDY